MCQDVCMVCTAWIITIYFIDFCKKFQLTSFASFKRVICVIIDIWMQFLETNPQEHQNVAQTRLLVQEWC